VYIVSPKDGAKVTSPVTVVFGLKGMGIAPAGIKMDNTGHHHLLVDAEVPADLSLPLAANEHSLHFGKGQTETSLTLAPGKHTLQLVLATRCISPTIRPWFRSRSPSRSANSSRGGRAGVPPHAFPHAARTL
jgi:hypothetical protein